MSVPDKFKHLVHIATLKQLNLKIDFWEDIQETEDIKGGHRYMPKKKFMDFNEFLEKINKEDFTQMTVGSKNGNVFNPAIRSSKEQNKRIESRFKYNVIGEKSYDYDEECDEDCEEYSYDGRLNIEIKTHIFPSYYMTTFQKGNLIKYEEGDHFDTFHYDTLNDIDIGTILIFIPTKFTGGDLVFKLDKNGEEEGEEFHVEPSKFTEMTAVIFGKILHKCEKITSGVRYVTKSTVVSSFKKKFSGNFLTEKDLENYKFESTFSQELKQKYINESKEEITAIVDTQFTQLKNNILYEFVANIGKDNKDFGYELAKLFNEFDMNMDLIQKSVKSTYYSLNNKLGSNDFCHKYQEKKHSAPVAYVLGYYYDHTNINSLHPNLIKFIRDAMEDGKKVSLIYCHFNITVHYDKDEGHNPKPRPARKLNYCYLENPINGKMESHESEYNDYSGYDNFYTYVSSCLYVG